VADIEAIRCLGCGHTFEMEEIYFLPYIGQRCTNCAFWFLDFYARSAYSILMTIKKMTQPRTDRKED
jgi:hypothetical protein